MSSKEFGIFATESFLNPEDAITWMEGQLRDNKGKKIKDFGIVKIDGIYRSAVIFEGKPNE